MADRKTMEYLMRNETSGDPLSRGRQLSYLKSSHQHLSHPAAHRDEILDGITELENSQKFLRLCYACIRDEFSLERPVERRFYASGVVSAMRAVIEKITGNSLSDDIDLSECDLRFLEDGYKALQIPPVDPQYGTVFNSREKGRLRDFIENNVPSFVETAIVHRISTDAIRYIEVPAEGEEPQERMLQQCLRVSADAINFGLSFPTPPVDDPNSFGDERAIRGDYVKIVNRISDHHIEMHPIIGSVGQRFGPDIMPGEEFIVEGHTIPVGGFQLRAVPIAITEEEEANGE